MEREAVKVVIRCRPFSEKELAAGHSEIVHVDTQNATVSIRDPRTESEQKTLTFDSVFDKSSVQQDFYDKTARQIVDSVLQGYNGTIFAYGQTGTGKVRPFNPDILHGRNTQYSRATWNYP